MALLSASDNTVVVIPDSVMDELKVRIMANVGALVVITVGRRVDVGKRLGGLEILVGTRLGAIEGTVVENRVGLELERGAVG